MLMKTPYLTSNDLGIDEKIYKALLEVKRQLDKGFIEPGQFCMGVVRTHPMECGTIACIGGWVGINLNLGVQATHRMVASASGSIRKLYFPDEIRSYHVDDAYRATSSQASEAINNYLILGDPKWQEVMEIA